MGQKNAMQRSHDVLPRFQAIEGIRALLAWWVVLAHMIDFSGFDARDLPIALRPLRQGILPVYVFMMISGFVITHLLINKEESYSAYVVRRFFRLFPLHFFILIAVVVAALAGIQVTRVDSNLLIERMLVELSMLNGLVPRSWEPASWGSLNTPNWSISVEMQFYLVAPLLIIPFTRKGKWRWTAGTVAAILIGISGLSYGRWLCYMPNASCLQFPHPSALPIVANYFAIGAGTYLLAFQRNIFGQSALAFLIVLIPLSLGGESHIPMILWAIVVTTVMFPESRLSKLLSSSPLVTLGTISYSTYLIHFPIVYFAGRAARKFGFSPQEMTTLGFIALCVIPTVLLLSLLAYRFIEKPGIRLGNIIARKLHKPSADTRCPEARNESAEVVRG